MFLAFQYPVEIPGVNNAYLLKAALNAVRKQRGLQELDAFDFLALIKGKMKLMQMDESFLSRGVNEGFSGGEKKRNEILQMAVLDNGFTETPFALPIIHAREGGKLAIDAALFGEDDLLLVFSLGRAYFMVDMEVPSAYVRVPRLARAEQAPPKAELYTLSGLQKQGKTLFFATS